MMTQQDVMARVQVDSNGCWIWTGAIDKQTGYGKIRSDIGPKVQTRSLHQLMWYWTHGVLSTKGEHLDHLCRVPACCNPAHLELVPAKVNWSRGKNGQLRTTCPQGHPYDGELVLKNGPHTGAVRRFCRRCKNSEQQRRYHRLKEPR